MRACIDIVDQCVSSHFRGTIDEDVSGTHLLSGDLDGIMKEGHRCEQPVYKIGDDGSQSPGRFVEIEREEKEKSKPSVEDPPSLKLKELPPHLEYAFLDEKGRLPVLVECNANSRTVVLNRPSILNALNTPMVLATPETLIGLHPDGGASFYLSRLPGYLGEYLGLTGNRLNGAEMMACGLATHYSRSANVRIIKEHLKNLINNDPHVIETSLQKYTDFVYPENNNVLKRMEMVNKCFSHDTVEEIIDALIREGRFQTLDECLVREYRMTLQGISGHISSDFCKGVRARMIDKDFTPKWDPPSLKDVSQDMVDRYFSPLCALEPGLELP